MIWIVGKDWFASLVLDQFVFSHWPAFVTFAPIYLFQKEMYFLIGKKPLGLAESRILPERHCIIYCF